MTRNGKSYLTLDELAKRWGLSQADLRYAIENGQLRVSIYVAGIALEFGTLAGEGDDENWITEEWCDDVGLLDLWKQDVLRLFRSELVEVRQFRGRDDSVRLLRVGIPVGPGDLVVKKEERQRFEAETLPTLRVETPFGDFRNPEFNGKRYRFTPKQAKVVRFLYEQAVAGNPPQSGKAVLDAAGSGLFKLSALFRRHDEWHEVIKGDGLGFYWLAPELIQRRAA